MRHIFTLLLLSLALVTTTRAAAEKLGSAYTNSLGMKFVAVPGTEVLFGVWDVRVQDYRAYANAVSGVDSSWQNPGFTQGDDHPVVNVSWNDAKAFCAWLSKREGKTYRLPTDAEWSVAVGLSESSGGTPKTKSGQVEGVYPWGTSWPPPSGAGNYADAACHQKYASYRAIEGYNDGYAETSPVGSFAANQFGLYDMGGNVWQWCEDWYDGGQKSRVSRGASWISGGRRDDLLSSVRVSDAPVNRDVNVGFRCVLADSSSR